MQEIKIKLNYEEKELLKVILTISASNIADILVDVIEKNKRLSKEELEEISKKNKTIKDIFYKIKGAEKSEQI